MYFDAHVFSFVFFQLGVKFELLQHEYSLVPVLMSVAHL